MKVFLNKTNKTTNKCDDKIIIIIQFLNNTPARRAILLN